MLCIAIYSMSQQSRYKEMALHKLIKVCMFALRLFRGCLHDSSLTQSLIFTAGQKCLERLSRLWVFFSAFERWVLRWYFPHKCDRRRQEENCDCVGGVEKKKCIVVSRGGKKDYEEFSAAMEFSLTHQHYKSQPAFHKDSSFHFLESQVCSVKTAKWRSRFLKVWNSVYHRNRGQSCCILNYVVFVVSLKRKIYFSII